MYFFGILSPWSSDKTVENDEPRKRPFFSDWELSRAERDEAMLTGKLQSDDDIEDDSAPSHLSLVHFHPPR
ncbi:MAG TPA: hypothetical protein VGM83_09145 [Devosiaceae bacterium]